VQTAWQTGLYLQDQIKLYQWILTLGSRYDWATLDTFDRKAVTEETRRDQALTKRVGLGYEFQTGLVPYVGYSESFTPVTGAAFDGTPFRPEAGQQYEVGIKYQPPGTKMRFAAAVYDLRRQNVLTPDLDPTHGGRSIQTGEVTSCGLELEAVANLTNNFSLNATYTYNDTRVTKSNNVDFGKRPARTPQHIASLWADYAIREGALNGLGFGAGVRYVGASEGDFTNTFEAPAYTLVDAMIRYDVDSWRFSVNASNLFDKYYVAACFSMAQCNLGRARTILGTVTYGW
jgi:iron complex outermembrane receptor protein